MPVTLFDRRGSWAGSWCKPCSRAYRRDRYRKVKQASAGLAGAQAATEAEPAGAADAGLAGAQAGAADANADTAAGREPWGATGGRHGRTFRRTGAESEIQIAIMESQIARARALGLGGRPYKLAKARPVPELRPCCAVELGQPHDFACPVRADRQARRSR